MPGGPATVHISVQSPCEAEQVVNKTNPNLYAGGTGDFQYIYLYTITVNGGTSWELRTFNGPQGPCSDPLVFQRDPAADDPVGDYIRLGGPGSAVIIPF